MGSQHREWDESRSPQWRYLLQNEALERKSKRREEGIRVKRVSKRKRLKAEKKVLNKKGQKIVYSADPGNIEHSVLHTRWKPTEKEKQNTEI